MASSLIPFLLLAMAFSTSVATAAGSEEEKTTHLRFYFHEKFQGDPDATSVRVAGLHKMSSSNFGNIVVFDNALREGTDPDSKPVGRAQGMAVGASMADQAVLTTINFVFTEGQYNGSTLALVGRVDASGRVDRTVVGGSGLFRLARGYASSKLVRNVSPTYIVVQFDFYVTHH